MLSSCDQLLMTDAVLNNSDAMMPFHCPCNLHFKCWMSCQQWWRALLKMCVFLHSLISFGVFPLEDSMPLIQRRIHFVQHPQTQCSHDVIIFGNRKTIIIIEMMWLGTQAVCLWLWFANIMTAKNTFWICRCYFVSSCQH